MVVRDGETGYLVQWRCPGPFVERLELLLANKHLRREMGAAARRHAKTLSWTVAGERLINLFESMVEAGLSPREDTARMLAPATMCGTAAGS